MISKQKNKNFKNRTLIYAHRGASGYKVENTISAFDLALDQGADGLESDIYLTTDGIPFLYHDSTIQLRSSDINGKVSIIKIKTGKLNSNELENIVLNDGEKVPTLEEFFERYAHKKSKSGTLIKFSFDFRPNCAIPTAKLAIKYNCEDQLYMCAKFGFSFRSVRKISEKIHLVASNSIRPLTFYTFRKSWSKYQKYNIEIFNIKAEDFQERYIQLLRDASFQFYIWDLHDEERLKKYLPYRPFGCYSNYPDLAIKIRDKIQDAI